MTAILVTNCDDWEALYVDGICIAQDHKVRLKDYLKQIGGELTEVEIDSEYTYEVGYLPERFENIPKAVFL